MSGPVVSNTTPISTLARVDRLDWIPLRWDQVTILGAVWIYIELTLSRLM